VRTRLVAISLAAVLALLGVVAILAYVRGANERAVNGLKAETVMVAAGAIPAGTSLSQAQQQHLLGTEKLPVSSLSSTTPAVQSVTAANEHLVMSSTVAKGQVLLQNMLAASTRVAASSGFVIPPNMVAVTVDLCVPAAVANYITPGSYVAVFDTLLGNASQAQASCGSGHQPLSSGALTNTNDAATVVVLPKVEVLAIGQNTGGQGTSGSSSVAATTDPASSSSSSGDVLVTLAVDQGDAERLILLDELGIPYLALLGSNSNVAPGGPVNLFPGQP
jgi:pilus assembly protein CpaB